MAAVQVLAWSAKGMQTYEVFAFRIFKPEYSLAVPIAQQPFRVLLSKEAGLPRYFRRACYGMKTLYLMRHAKSSWSFDDLSDEQRPLNDRGRDDAPRMGQALAKRHIQLGLLVSSGAVRALSTAALVAKELDYPPERIAVRPEIYEADLDTLLGVVHSLPDEAQSVLLVGHNNTITDLANYLSPSPLQQEMPTAGIVCLHFHTDRWADVARANAEFYFFDRPREQS